MVYAKLWEKDLSHYNHAPKFKRRSPKELQDRVAAPKNECPWRAHDIQVWEGRHSQSGAIPIMSSEDVRKSDGGYELQALSGHPPGHPRAAALGPYPQRYFVNPEYAGLETARGASQAFYRTAPAYLETLELSTVKR
jgi:hypothetical protein